MTKEEQLLKNRFLDLANTTYQRNIPTATDFLTLYEKADKALYRVKENGRNGFAIFEEEET